jgi:TolB-like protein
MKIFVALTALGFPIALIIAWAFELTPKGLKRAESADELPKKSARNRVWIYVVVVAGAISVSLFFLGRYTARNKQSGPAEVATKSIAVLPFENLSEEKANAYFANGIQEEILTRFAKIADLKVISRTSTQQYQSKPGSLSEIAKQLGVAHILEGSVQKAGDQVRVNVQLINAQTDAHLWADTYDRKLTDIFGVESEIAKERAIVLKPRAEYAQYGPGFEENLALIRTIIGENSGAISILARLLEIPYSSPLYGAPIMPALLRLDPTWDPLRADPTFRKLCEARQDVR